MLLLIWYKIQTAEEALCYSFRLSKEKREKAPCLSVSPADCLLAFLPAWLHDCQPIRIFVRLAGRIASR